MLRPTPCLHRHLGTPLQGQQAEEWCGCSVRSPSSRRILRMLPVSLGCLSHKRFQCAYLKPVHCQRAPVTASCCAPWLLPDSAGLRAVSRRIAESMKRINSDHEARQARSDSAMGIPKTCAVCGLPGHNKRTCPQITHPAVRLTRHVLCALIEAHHSSAMPMTCTVHADSYLSRCACPKGTHPCARLAPAAPAHACLQTRRKSLRPSHSSKAQQACQYSI